MPRQKQEISVIERNGAKTVARKTSWVKRVKIGFTVFSVIWIGLSIWAPLHIKNTYSAPIKKSIVVSMFFDLQKNIVKQYEQLLAGVRDAINLEKPIGIALDAVKIADNAVDTVTDTTKSAKKVTNDARAQTDGAKKLSGLAGKFGIKTSGLDRAIDAVDDTINDADKNIARVDNTAAKVNAQLDSVKTKLTKTMQTEFDKMLDATIKEQLDKNSGGLGTTLLTNYGVEHVYPWRPSSWPVATKIYNDLAASDVTTITVITDTVDDYFGYVAWGLVIAAWVICGYIWFSVRKYVRKMLKPFIVCPRCGNAFADKRTAFGFLKAFKPWEWLQ